MANLLKQTIEALTIHKRTPADVMWVQTEKGWFSWDQFAAVADFEYDDGYGGPEVHPSLMVVGEDWWLERGEYDGAEWWEFKRKPEMPRLDFTPTENDLKDRW